MAPQTTTHFHRNAVLVCDDGTKHRLLRLDLTTHPGAATGEVEYAGTAWLILLGAPLALPYKIAFHELQARFRPLPRDEGQPARAKSELFTPTMKALGKPPSEASLRLSERAMARIEPLVDNPDIFEPSKRHALLVARSQEPGCGTPKTLLKDLRYWWQGGQTQDALLGKYSNCARPQTVGTAGRGRKKTKYLAVDADGPSDPTAQTSGRDALEASAQLIGKTAYQLTEADLANMKEVIETYYFDKEVRRTLANALQRLHEDYYTYQDGNGDTYLRPVDECPSYRQLSYFLRSNYPLAVIEARRKGKKRFALEDRSTEGSIQIECHGVGHIYEFDATVLDLPLVSSSNRQDIVGKPTLYLIIDRGSRLIVGFYLGFESANYSAAMQAILSIGQDKEELCRSLGIPYDPADWPAHGILPESFLADQGELMHKKARRIARSVRSTISNVPGLRPDWKPLVECGIGMLHQIIAPDTPGHSPDSENRKRRSVNRTRSIALNIREATKLIVSAIIAHNKSPQLGYPLSLQQASDGVRPIPRELWQHDIVRRMGVLDQMDYEKLREELMPRSKATVSEDGILFEGMYYSCPEATKRGWLVEGRRRRRDVDIAFDYRLVDEIIVYAPNGSGESYVAKLTGDSVMFEGLSHKEVSQHFGRVNSLHQASGEEKRHARFEHRQRTEPMNDNARREVMAQTKGLSRSSRRADTANARSAELQAERARLAGVRRTSPVRPGVSDTESVGSATSTSLNHPAPRMHPTEPEAQTSTSAPAKVIPLRKHRAQPDSSVAIGASNDGSSTTSRSAVLDDGAAAPRTPLTQRLAALRRGLLA